MAARPCGTDKPLADFIVGQGENLPEKVWAADSTVEIVSKPAATNWWAVFGTWVLPLVVIVALSFTAVICEDLFGGGK